MLHSANGGQIVVPSDADTLTFYEATSGYVLGNESTDQGADETTVSRYLVSNGLAGVKSTTTAPIAPANIDHIKAFTYGVTDFKPYWYLVLAGIFVTVWVVRRLERSRVGRAWMAIREDEDVAELMGVPTYRMRLWAFAIGAAVGGLAGVFFAAQANHIEPLTFSYQVSILVLAAVVLGGSGNMAGVILGAFLVAWLPERFRGFDKYRILVFGVALVVMMIFRPEGLLPSRRRKAELSDVGGGGGMGAPLVPPSLEEAEA